MGASPVTITPDSAPVTITPDAEPHPGFWDQVVAKAKAGNYGAGEFANPDHPAHTLLKLAMHDIENGDYSKGAHGLLGAAAEFLKPTLPLTIAAAPITSALAFAGSPIAAKAGQAVATHFGATPDQATLAGDVAGIATGAGVSKLSSLAGNAEVAQRMYRSALKPSTTFPESKTQNIVNTGLRENIPVSASGVEKLGSLIDNLNDKIAGRIRQAGRQGVTVNRLAVASRLGDVGQEFSEQVTPASDLAAIQKSGEEFMGAPSQEIPAEQAQGIKVGTYRQLRKKYGELGSADVESQKALARGIKEELASQIPEIGDLNARESDLIGLDKSLERAVSRISNHQIIGIGTPIAAGGVKAITGSTGLAAVLGVLKGVVDDPIIKSKLAIAMARKGVPGSTINSRLAAYSAALEGAAIAAPPDHQANAQ